MSTGRRLPVMDAKPTVRTARIRGRVLTGPATNGVNTVDDPWVVRPAPAGPRSLRSGLAATALPLPSITVLEVRR